MNNGPIQQLVDAAHAFCRACCITRESDEAEQQAILEAYNKTRTALAAVESAQVETRWQVEGYSSEDGWVGFNIFETQKAAEKFNARSISVHQAKRIVRLDTYRSVESDQK